MPPPDPLFYVCLGTNDFARAVRFYDAVMPALGYARCQTPGEEMGWQAWAGWGHYAALGAVQSALWICAPFDGAPASAGNGTMVALRAPNRDAVHAFHRAALALGGSSDGEPGLRPQYNADFYAAYVRDPDGNKLAAVCRGA